jgi:hypothetical protein
MDMRPFDSTPPGIARDKSGWKLSGRFHFPLTCLCEPRNNRGVAIPPDCHSLDNAHFVVTQWNRDKSESFNITLRINAVKNLAMAFLYITVWVTRYFAL